MQSNLQIAEEQLEVFTAKIDQLESEVQMLREDKVDLNKTCVVIETRLKVAEMEAAKSKEDSINFREELSNTLAENQELKVRMHPLIYGKIVKYSETRFSD